MKNLETERLLLRKVTLDDLDDLFENWGSDVNTTKFLTFKTHETKKETEKFINHLINNYENGELEWVIELKENNKVIGVISANKGYKYKCVEIGYSISSLYWNHGLTTEAVNRVIKYLFNEYDCNIVEAIIPSNNIASIKVIEKCGLTLEATLKDRYKDKKNVVQDLLIYSIFNSKTLYDG